MLQADDLFKMVTEVHSEYVLLSVEQQYKDDDWFDEIDASMLQFRQKIHGWIRYAERERDAAKLEAKSKRSSVSGSARAKMLKDLEDDSVNLAISHNSKIDIAYNPLNNRNIESGIMPARKGVITKKLEAHQQNVEAHQAPVMSFHHIKIGDQCSDIKEMLPSPELTDMLYKLLNVQSAPDVDMECFDGSVLEYY